MVPPEDLRRKRKIWRLLKNRCGIRDTSQVFATHVEEGHNKHGLQKDAVVLWWYWKATLKTCSVHWRDGFTPAISGVRANDLRQLMLETFRVRACERVDAGFLTTVEILHRKVAWKAEDFFWINDPKYTLALADEFGFVGMKKLEQTKNILVAPGTKTMNKSLHDGADVLDERETQQRRSLISTARNDGQDRPETRYTTVESARFMSDLTRAVKSMLQCEVRVVIGTYLEGEQEGLSTTGAWICFGGYLLETYSSIQQIVALFTTESEYISTKDVAHALEIRSDLAECDMTLKMKGKTDLTAGRATAARRGVGRLHHFYARLSGLQRLWAEGVVHWCLRWSQPGEHNEADLESKKIDSTSLLKGTPLRPPVGWSLRMVAASFPEVEAARDCRVSIWNVRNVCETNGWFWICVGMSQ